MEIKKRLVGILSEITGIEIEAENDLMLEDLSIDSLRIVLLLVMIEDEFDIVLDESDLDPLKLKSFDDMVNLVSKYLSTESENV